MTNSLALYLSRHAANHTLRPLEILYLAIVATDSATGSMRLRNAVRHISKPLPRPATKRPPSIASRTSSTATALEQV